MPEITLFTLDPTNSEKWFYIFGVMLLGFAFVFSLTKIPTQSRRPIIWVLTFLAGAVFVGFQYWPQPVRLDPKTEIPTGFVESVGLFFNDANSAVGGVAQTLAAFMLGLGIFSLLKIHGTKIMKQQKDWSFSLVLILSMFTMIFFGYWDYRVKMATPTMDYDNPANWTTANMGLDFLFDKLLQQMDAAMFAIIAFFILSAAYRAFRARSIEATILLGTALLVIFSLMGALSSAWDSAVVNAATSPNGDKNAFLWNFQITEIASWIRNTFQTPAITGIRFGIGLGTLSMALRIWLGLERGGK
ncbi:MAG TPA: hypothetical protein VK171_12910 [Fimbriimonas sp.]|nr:hypothetical protein [Fimbriimonas sp.]